jgi:hypothetical protein
LSEILAAIQEIDGRLHTDPMVFGEPTLDVKHKQGQARIAVVRLVSVQYVVFVKERKVIVTRPLVFLGATGTNPP